MASIAWEFGGRQVMTDGSVVTDDASGVGVEDREVHLSLVERMELMRERWGVEKGEPFNVFHMIERVEFCGYDEDGMRAAGEPEQFALRWELVLACHQLAKVANKCGLQKTELAIYGLLVDQIGEEDRELARMVEGYSHQTCLQATQDDLRWLREHPVGTVVAHDFADGGDGDSHYITIVTDHGDRLVKYYEGVDEYGTPGQVTLEVKTKSS